MNVFEQDPYLASALEKTKGTEESQSSFIAGIPPKVSMWLFGATGLLIIFAYGNPSMRMTWMVVLAVMWVGAILVGRTQAKPSGELLQPEARVLVEKYIQDFLIPRGLITYQDSFVLSIQNGDHWVTEKNVHYIYDLMIQKPNQIEKHYMIKVHRRTGDIVMPLSDFEVRGDELPAKVIPKIAQDIMDKFKEGKGDMKW